MSNFKPVTENQTFENLLLAQFTVVHSIEVRKDAVGYNKFVGSCMN